MVVPGISQTLRRYQGNKVMACEKLYSDCKTHENINGLHLFSLASDRGISGIMPDELSIIRN